MTRTCDECGELLGNDVFPAGPDLFICRDCFWQMSRREAEMQEAADDDRAHAMRERMDE